MKMNRRWWLLVIVSCGVLIPFMAPYVTLDSANSRVPISNTMQYSILVAHIGFASLALISGFFQFIDRIRNNNPKIHRYLGRIYVYSVFISGLLALLVIFYIENFAKATSFLALSGIWMFTCWKGYRTALRKDFTGHRIWMIRSFGVTLVAVSGRVIMPVLLLTYYMLNGFSLPGGREEMVEEALNANIWVGLLLNFVIVEWIILKRKNNR